MGVWEPLEGAEEMREVLLQAHMGGGRPSEIWEVLRCSGIIYPTVSVRGVGGKSLYP